MKRYLVLAIVYIFFTSCEKLKNENVIPEDAVRLTEYQQQYADILTDSPEGWYIEYAPASDKGAVSILMQFYADGKVSMLSDMYGFNQEKISTYRIGGVTKPELIFDTYSVWSAIAESAGGNFEFLMYPQDNGNVILRNIFEDTNRDFVLRKATTADKDEIIAKSGTSELLKSFNDNASAYFKNVVLQNVSAFWDINISTQQLTLTWEEDGTTVSKTFSYANLANGIRLAEDWKVGNSITVRDIQFGSATANTLEIVSAGTAGTGQIEVSHIPAFPYKGTAEVYIFSNLNKPNEETVRFLGYTVDRNAISDALKPYYDAVTNAIPTFWRIQVYNLSPVTAPQNRFALVGKNDQNSNIWYYFNYNLTIEDGSHVGISYINENPPSGYAAVGDHPDVKALLDRIYPPAGVTIVPLASQKIRVISRENSNYWIELTVSTPANAF